MKTKFIGYYLALIIFTQNSICAVISATEFQQKVISGSPEKIEALVVLIEFADRTAYFSRNEVDDFFNQIGYSRFNNNGSIHDYWAAVSQNRIDVHTNVTATYYKAPKSFDYYDIGDGTGHTHELLDSALNWLEKSGFDFSKLTVDANNNIKALSFQFVGNSGQKGLWGHSSYHGRSFDGVNTASYQISELGTAQMHLGGICHEQGHMLFGWPDTYDIDASNGGSSGCGKFDLMAGGNSDNTGAPSANPMPPNPYFRYLAGWNDMISLNEFPNDTTIKIIVNSWNTYVYRNPDRAGEMYIIEARKKPERNVDMPGEGVLVWHIDSLISNNANQQHTEQQHYKVSVVQADNRYDLERGANIGDSNDYYRLGGYTNTLSYLYTKWWNSALSGLQLRNISALADTMTAKFGTSNASDVAIKSEKSLGGSVSPFGLKYFSLNSSQTYNAAPANGFEVEECIVDGVSQGKLTSYTFDNLKTAHSIQFTFAHKAVKLKNVVGIIKYDYYEGTWSSMPDFSQLTPVKSGNLISLNLNISGRINDNFGIHYYGYINAPEDGEYTFYLKADDGSCFKIDGIEIVSNQCEPEKTGKIILKKGYHSFTLDFFEVQITESLSLKWSSQTLSKRVLTGLVSGDIDTNTAIGNLYTHSNTKLKIVGKNLIIGSPENTNITVQVLNTSGMLIREQNLISINGLFNMNISDIKSGIYFVKINSEYNTILIKKVNIIK